MKTMQQHQPLKNSQNASIQLTKPDCALQAAVLIQLSQLIASLSAYKNVCIQVI
jgi:hypothetical protein